MARLDGPEGPDPDFPVPDTVAEARAAGRGRGILDWLAPCARRRPRSAAAGNGGEGEPPLQDVLEDEFLWMEARRPLRASAESLALDYGRREAASPPATPAEAFRGFGRSLGRVVTYRALAIDDAALERILEADCIFPSGQLRVGPEALAQIVEAKGVQTVCVARLFIAHLRRLLGQDPSISLHDDWQTTALIASGYAGFGPKPDKRVHLFEVSCPRVESIGWTLQEVALQRGEVLADDGADHPPWFLFPAPAVPQGVWFDGRRQRTERYGLYGVPFLSRRLRRLLVFGSVAELSEAVGPFARRQAELHAQDDEAAS
mmetsp:Transcript_82159/g.255114  ORF Transcript_82159/g.255114 Transcript_82159/m.255114 type:complete len:317 (-) Transcript_82159:71-1021(-)